MLCSPVEVTREDPPHGYTPTITTRTTDRPRTPRDEPQTRSAQITHLPTPVEPKLLHGVRHIGPGSSDRECKDKPIGIDLLHSCLPQPARLALPLQQHEDVALTDRTLDVPHDRARGVVEELNAHLDHRAGLASAAEDLGHLRELDGLILRRGAGGQGPSATASGSQAGLRSSRQGATVQRGPSHGSPQTARAADKRVR